MNKSVALGMTLALLSATSFYAAADEHLIRVGFNPGPYKEQFEKGVAPYLLSKGYKIEYKDFTISYKPFCDNYFLLITT